MESGGGVQDGFDEADGGLIVIRILRAHHLEDRGESEWLGCVSRAWLGDACVSDEVMRATFRYLGM